MAGNICKHDDVGESNFKGGSVRSGQYPTQIVQGSTCTCTRQIEVNCIERLHGVSLEKMRPYALPAPYAVPGACHSCTGQEGEAEAGL